MANKGQERAKILTDKKGNIQHIRLDGKVDNYKSKDTEKYEEVKIDPKDYK